MPESKRQLDANGTWTWGVGELIFVLEEFFAEEGPPYARVCIVGRHYRRVSSAHRAEKVPSSVDRMRGGTPMA